MHHASRFGLSIRQEQHASYDDVISDNPGLYWGELNIGLHKGPLGSNQEYDLSSLHLELVVSVPSLPPCPHRIIANGIN